MTRDVDVPDVLLVEDNPGDVRLVREAFAESAVESSLAVVTDGEAALDYLAGRDDSELQPDLVLLDLNVPKVNGRKVLEAIRDDPDLDSVPVIVLSSSEARADVRETYELESDGYFVKPVDPNEFMSLVRTIERAVIDSGELPLGEYADIDRTE